MLMDCPVYFVQVFIMIVINYFCVNYNEIYLVIFGCKGIYNSQHIFYLEIHITQKCWPIQIFDNS